jgi:peptide/nickel transport system permease protein
VIRYVARRLLWGAVTLVVVCALSFLLFRVFPSANPAALRAGRNPNPNAVANIEKTLGLNRPLTVQFWDYMKDVLLHFNLGYSYYSDAPVKGLIAERLAPTVSLVFGAAVLWIVAGLGVGVLAALRPRSWLDRTSMSTALVLISTPEFWLGLVLLLLFASDIGQVRILPGAGTYVGLTVDPWKWFTSLILPWVVLASGAAAVFARLMRSGLMESMGEDFIRTARAKGLRERHVVRQGVRASINPITTVLGLEIGTLLGGALVVERVFIVHGIGQLAFNGIGAGDFSVVQGTVLVSALFVVLANIVVDIGYAYLDPRVRYT